MKEEKEMINMIKLAFFDVDGTLSAPQYLVNGKLQIGMSDTQWQKYCDDHGEDTYEYCKPVKAVKEYALSKKAQGATLYVLTSSQGENENKGKRKFIEQHYSGIFEEVIPVAHDADKVKVIKAKAEEKGVKLSECEIVEDTFKILLETVCEGIVSTHVANIFAEKEK